MKGRPVKSGDNATGPPPTASCSLDEGPPGQGRRRTTTATTGCSAPRLDEGPPGQRAVTWCTTQSRPHRHSLDEGPPAQGRRRVDQYEYAGGVQASMKGRPLKGGNVLRRLGRAAAGHAASMKGRPLKGGDRGQPAAALQPERASMKGRPDRGGDRIAVDGAGLVLRASMKGRPLRGGDRRGPWPQAGRAASMKGRPLRGGDGSRRTGPPCPPACLDEGPPAQGRRPARRSPCNCLLTEPR